MDVAFCVEMNYGDCLTIDIMPYASGVNCNFYHWANVPSDRMICLGIGTLVDYIIRLSWFRDRDVILLGTGTNNFGSPVEAKFRGFARGELSAQRLGVEAIGDMGILADRVMGRVKEVKEQTILCLGEKAVTDDIKKVVSEVLPDVRNYNCNAAMAVGGTRMTYRDIASSRYVVTDKLHYAMTAEAVGNPWVIYHHHEGTLFEQPLRFNDWADMIGKSKFIISDLSQLGIIKENNNFEKSEKQKDKLIKRTMELAS